MHHILKRHGANGSSDHSMANPDDSARLAYTLVSPDDIRHPHTTKAYSRNVNGKSKPADAVLYHKRAGTKSYCFVQAVAETKARTLYVVSAFIGEPGYKERALGLNDAKGPNDTAETESASNLAAKVPQVGQTVKAESSPDGRNFSRLREPVEPRDEATGRISQKTAVLPHPEFCRFSLHLPQICAIIGTNWVQRVIP